MTAHQPIKNETVEGRRPDLFDIEFAFMTVRQALGALSGLIDSSDSSSYTPAELASLVMLVEKEASRVENVVMPLLRGAFPAELPGAAVTGR